MRTDATTSHDEARQLWERIEAHARTHVHTHDPEKLREAEATDPIVALFRERPAREAAKLLAEACRDLTPEELGFHVFPRLRRLLRGDDVFRGVAETLTDPRLPAAYRVVLTDFVDGAARARDAGQREAYWQLLRGVVRAAGDSIMVRARALRALVRDDGPETRELVGEALRWAEAEVVSAAAHVVCAWHRKRRLVPEGAAAALAEFARRSARETLYQPPILMALARLQGEGSPSIRELAAREHSDEERARLFAAAIEGMDGDTLARLVEASERDDAAFSRLVLLAAVRQGEVRDHVTRFVDHPSVRRMLEEAANRPERIGSTPGGKGPTIKDPKIPSARGVSIAPPQGVLLHSGDALYRDLITKPLWDNHWHAGVYVGLSVFSSGVCEMLGIHAAYLLGDTIERFRASEDFASPDTDVAARMVELKKKFLKAFREGKGENIVYHGAHNVPGMTPQQRRDVADTALAMYGKGIWYTAEDQLDYTWWDWDGTISDIDEARCDGVVEYSYEKQNLRVCGGEDPKLWNISKPGTKHVENHNDLHTFAYDPGETCPRIQAGSYGHGSDTRMVITAGGMPSVARFDVAIPGPLPQFRIRVDTPQYAAVRVRLIVSKDGGPWHFVRTELSIDDKPALSGEWRFRQVIANVEHRAFWGGATVGGPSFAGKDGSYRFRLVAVDGGGNVSELFQAELAVRWPHPVHIHGLQYDPPGPDLNAEHVAIRNVGGASQVMTGWTLRDAAGHTFLFPSFTLGSGKEVKVWTGKGNNNGQDLFWGRPAAVWNNDGDTATLHTPDGKEVSRFHYS